MMEYFVDLFDFSNNQKEECSICFEEKKLKPFCSNHNFCHKCCKEWANKNILCPICRNKCINNNYMKYDFELTGNVQHHENYFIVNLDYYFLSWHKPSCLKKKHKFRVIEKTNSNTVKPIYIMQCTECNVEQSFD